MEQNEFFFGTNGLSLPSPKLKRGQKDGFASWAPFLAAFSEQFAVSALEKMRRNPNEIIYDPFVGSGTTLVAAAKLGISAVGNDIDPVSALVSRAKVAAHVDPAEVHRYLRSGSSELGRFAAGSEDYFTQSNLRYATLVFSRVAAAHSPRGKHHLLDRILADCSGKFDTEAVTLAALVMAGKSIAQVLRGSNPVWFRKALQSEKIQAEDFAQVARCLADRMIADLVATKRGSHRPRMTVTCGNALDVKTPKIHFDTLLTSPPYLNRLDYVVHHLPESLVLSGFYPIQVDALRRRMIGTTKILSKDEPDERLGVACHKLLRRIKSHSSYASSRYYYFVYAQYFTDMFNLLSELARHANPGAHGIMVVQNSYHKELLIDSTQIFSDMATNIGFDIQPLQSEEVTVHYGTLSPRQLQYVPKKRLREWLLYLRFGH